MKKAISILLVVLTMFTLTVNALAASSDFVPSITNKGAPELVYTTDDSGNKVIGYVKDENGTVLSTEKDECVVITSVSDADGSKDIPADAKAALKAAYDQLTKTDVKLSTACPALNDVVKKALGEYKNADNLIVKDLFDVSVLCEDLKTTHLPKEGTTLALTFKLGIAKDAFVTAMSYKNGAWNVVDTVNNGDGTVTATFEHFCPVAFLVEDTTTPSTGDNSNSYLAVWYAVMAVSLVLAVALVVVFRRKKVN